MMPHQNDKERHFQPAATAPFGRVVALQWAGQGLFYGIRSKKMSSKNAVRFLVTDERGNRICENDDEAVYQAATDWMPLERAATA